jgi:hypothetical protein
MAPNVLTALSDVCCLGKSLTQSGLLRFHWVDFPLTSQLLSFWRLTLNEGIRSNVNLETVSGGYF